MCISADSIDHAWWTKTKEISVDIADYVNAFVRACAKKVTKH